MIDIFFAILVLISFFSMSIYSLFYEKKDFLYLFIITIIIFPIIKLNFYASLLSILFLLTPVILRKKLDFTQLMFFCMFGSILMSYFLLEFFLAYDIPYIFWITMITVILICVLGIMGIFEDDLKKYLIYSNIIQLAFVLLDLGVAKIAGKITTLGTIQIFNYVFAGLLLFTTVGVLSEDNKIKKISHLHGSFYRDKYNSLFSIVSALSLAGLPGLNIFVSEWFLFKTSFMINPIITIFGIFAALLLFVMYFKLANILFIGEGKPLKRNIKPLIYLNGIFAALCLLFGLIPQIQIYILNMVLS